MGSSPFRIRGAAAQVAAMEVHCRQVGARAPAQQVVGVGGRLLPRIPRHHHVTRQLGVLHRRQIAEPAVEVAVGGIDLPPDLAWRRRQCSQGC